MAKDKIENKAFELLQKLSGINKQMFIDNKKQLLKFYKNIKLVSVQDNNIIVES